MCGRFAQVIKYSNLRKYLKELEQVELTIPINFNVAPTHNVGAIFNWENRTVCDLLHWQLTPSWSKSLDSKYKIINTRIESIIDKPIWRGLFQHKRCLIPANGFYEWDKSTKTPNYFYRKDNKLLFFAGIYDVWHSADGSFRISFSILTTDSNADMVDVHPRMPIIIENNNLSDYLNNKDFKGLINKIRLNEVSIIDKHVVSKAVNKVSNNYPKLIEPYIIEDNLSIF